ncbi:hypothetical protein ACVWZK_004161 [Bradyrhizobium sp. GM0.4]
MLVQAATLALVGLGPISSAPIQEVPVQQIQFPGRAGGCPVGYDFNFSNGRCYPNSYHAPGVYKRPLPDDPPYGYRYRHHRYSDRPGYGYGPRYYDRY